jgi:hypothetical protein
MIKLKEGQKVLDESGNVYLIEKGDLVESRLQEGASRKTIKEIANYATFAFQDVKAGLYGKNGSNDEEHPDAEVIEDIIDEILPLLKEISTYKGSIWLQGIFS